MSQESKVPEDAIVSNDSGADTVIDVKEFFGKLQPFIEKLMDIYSQLAPYIHSGLITIRKLYNEKIEPFAKQYYFKETTSVILGIILLFFGGNFAMTIACYTALQISGWPMVVSSYKKIRNNYDAGMDAFSKDKDAQSVFDKNNDGKITGMEIKSAAERWLKGSKEEKLEILSHFRNVLIAIDPKECMNGFTGLWSVTITLLATLRSAFAKDVALGVSIGNTLTRSFSRHIKPFIIKTSKIEDDMKPWLDFLIETCCKFIGVSIAFMMIRVVSAFHSAVKGGSLLTRYLFQFLLKQGLAPTITNNNNNNKSNNKLNNDIESNTFFMIVQYSLAMYGFWSQLSAGFQLGFFLRLILFPFVLLETILTLLAAY